MEAFHNHKSNSVSVRFIIIGLLFLLSALTFGLMAASEYAFPGLWRNAFPFTKLRPLHVSSALFWIIITAMGVVLLYLQQHNQLPLKRLWLVKLLFNIFLFSFISILISYCFGVFGGREYWEFNPIFAIPIVLGWAIFIIIFLSNVKGLKGQPVYIWMWFTGVLFFFFTYLESNLWLIPSIRNHLAKDMTIQWKSYGSMVGSWNLLIYGSSIYLMDKIAGNKKYSYSKMAFFLYFLGLFNLMFNWGHHIYTLPTQPYVKHIGYIVSMTELLIYGRIIYLWKSSLSIAKRHFKVISYKFLIAADAWVFITLSLAIAMSIPVLNLYMHGTHIIVAHTMGATIGINSFLLLAFAFDIIGGEHHRLKLYQKSVTRGYWVMNISLCIFWLSLICAGIVKSHWLFMNSKSPFEGMVEQQQPWFYVFFVSGIALVIGFLMVVVPLLKVGLSNPQKSVAGTSL